MPRTSSQSKHAAWKQRFDRFKSSQQTVEAFCDDVGCSVATFYYWKHKLEASGRRETAETQSTASAFLPVIVRNSSTSPVVVRLVNGARVSVPASELAALDVVLQYAQRAAR